MDDRDDSDDGMELKYVLKLDGLFLTESGLWNIRIFAHEMTYGQADSAKIRHPGSEIEVVSQLQKSPSGV